jgi:hypothetical protein
MAFIREVGFTNDSTITAFGRCRTAEDVELLSVTFQYDLHPLHFQTVTSGAGTVVKTTNVSSATLSVGTASGDLALIQSRAYVRYQPGHSQLVTMEAVLGAAKSNVQSEVGYYDNNDGMFFRQANGIFVVIRSSTSGAPVDTAIAQANWNVDRFDGTGPSGAVLNPTLSQMFVIDMEWPNGRIRFGFFINGKVFYCHQVLGPNTAVLPLTNTANLPMRWRIANTGVAVSGTSMAALCGGVGSEGGTSVVPGLPFTAFVNGVGTTVPTTRTPVLSIQVKTTFAGITNREQVIVDQITTSTQGGTNIYEIVLNGTLTGAAFASVDATNKRSEL